MTKPGETGTGNRDEDALLETFFDEARAAAPSPSRTLVERILADAENQQAPLAPTTRRPAPSLLSRLRDALGGWGGVGGLATATIAGLYIGFVQPSPLGLAIVTGDTVDVADVSSWTDSDFWPLDDLAFEEG